MKPMKWTLFVLCALSAASIVSAAEIAFFDNDTYTDVDEESTLIAASLTNLGHNLHYFSGITAADWQTATQGVDLLLIPELDNGDLFPDLSGAAIDVIYDYVRGGGGLIMVDRSGGPTPNMLNGIFGYSLVGGGGGVTYLNAATASGTLFEGGPASLPDADATELFMTSSLPPGALDLYNDQVDETSVFVADELDGNIGYLGFDWYEDPTPAGWEEVLGLVVMAVQGTSKPTSIPTLSIIGSAAMVLALLALGLTILSRRTH